jgi:hypothetical protein
MTEEPTYVEYVCWDPHPQQQESVVAGAYKAPSAADAALAYYRAEVPIRRQSGTVFATPAEGGGYVSRFKIAAVPVAREE